MAIGVLMGLLNKVFGRVTYIFFGPELARRSFAGPTRSGIYPVAIICGALVFLLGIIVLLNSLLK